MSHFKITPFFGEYSILNKLAERNFAVLMLMADITKCSMLCMKSNIQMRYDIKKKKIKSKTKKYHTYEMKNYFIH